MEDKIKEGAAEGKQESTRDAVISLLCSIGVSLCWFFRNFEFRQKISGPAAAEQSSRNFLMMDFNVALRRAMLVLAICGLIMGLKAVFKRCKRFDIAAFIISAVVGLLVGYIVYKMGGKGFWLGA